jgi:SAM-dependent methyltransferase
MDKAGVGYWDDVWEGEALPDPIDPDDASLDNEVNRQIDRLLGRLFPERQDGRALLEVGAARSAWLPYFARRFGFAVTGLDYSARGAEQARQILAAADVAGHVVQADMFVPPAELLDRFDVVISFGVVEHFDDTAAALAALARFARRGGVIITSVPNMAGWVGTLQRRLNPSVYAVHKPISRADLVKAHRTARLELLECRHFMGMNWSVVNIAGWQDERRRQRVARILSRVSKVSWLIERRGLRFPRNRLTSPYIVAVARRGSEDPDIDLPTSGQHEHDHALGEAH